MNNTAPHTWQSLTLRTIVFLLLWALLTRADPSGWWLGIPAGLLAAYLSVRLFPPRPWSLLGLLRFLPYFAWNSLKGSIDVAGRAFRPDLPIEPGLITYRFKRVKGSGRVFMANVISLLPGTLVADINGECLRVHVLDKSTAFQQELSHLEQHTAAIFIAGTSAGETVP